MIRTSLLLVLILSGLVIYLESPFTDSLIKHDVYQKQVSPPGELRVCSLNLHRLGAHKNREINSFRVKGPAFNRQLTDLAKRVIDGSCHIVGLQELIGSKKDDSSQILDHLITKLSQLDNKRLFQAVIGESRDPWNRNAFLYDTSLLKIDYQESAYRQVLPSLDPRSRSWSHSRGPLVAVFSTATKPSLTLAVINYHFKSKANGWKDASGTNFELARLHAAAGVRELHEIILSKYPNPVSILLGDRNTGPSGGASEILSGRLSFNDFRPGTACRISEEGTALCPPEIYRKPDMIPIIQRKGVETGKEIGTYKRGRRIEILDEIFVSEKHIDRVRDQSGRLRAGVIGEYRKGSDHLMSWVGVDLDAR